MMEREPTSPVTLVTITVLVIIVIAMLFYLGPLRGMFQEQNPVDENMDNVTPVVQTLTPAYKQSDVQVMPTMSTLVSVSTVATESLRTIPDTPTPTTPTVGPTNTTMPHNMPGASPSAPPPTATATGTISTPSDVQLQGVLQRATKAEADLRTGQLEARIEHSGGSPSTANILFDFGDQSHPPRLNITTTYEGPQGKQTVERITIGDRTWQRVTGGNWLVIAEAEGVWGQLQPYLPHLAQASEVEFANGGNPGVLVWHDAGRQLQIWLQVDPATGFPKEMSQLSLTTASFLKVRYSGWNTPVEIKPPPGS